MSEPADRRKEPRFRVQNTRKLTVELQSDEEKALPVSLIDVSRSGAKFISESPIQTAEAIRLRLAHRKLGLEIAVPAVVRWCHVKQNHWEIGVSFVDAVITEDVLDKLAKSGIVERRRAKRHEVDATAKLELPGQTEGTAVIVRDVSEEGTGLISPKPVEIGERLLLTFDSQDSEPVSFVAISRWQSPLEDQFRVGCQIAMNQSQPILKTCGVETEKPRREPQRISWLTWVVMLTCAACTWSLAGLPPEVVAELKDLQFDDRFRKLWPW